MPKFDEDFDEDDTTAGKGFWHTNATGPSYPVVYSYPNESWLQEINQRLDKIIFLLEKIVYKD